MKDEHIIERLDAGPLALMSQPDREVIEQHVAACEACRREYSLARFAEDLVRARVADAVEPPPFFQTRVLAAWRERAVADFWSFARLWRNAGALVSSMAATVAVLVALTFVMPGTTTSTGPADAPVAQANTYSAEDVIFDSDGFATVSDGQAATTIMDEDDEGR
jgi:predicted anti-sigma-YlaC factor YlaD